MSTKVQNVVRAFGNGNKGIPLQDGSVVFIVSYDQRSKVILDMAGQSLPATEFEKAISHLPDDPDELEIIADSAPLNPIAPPSAVVESSSASMPSSIGAAGVSSSAITTALLEKAKKEDVVLSIDVPVNIPNPTSIALLIESFDMSMDDVVASIMTSTSMDMTTLLKEKLMEHYKS